MSITRTGFPMTQGPSAGTSMMVWWGERGSHISTSAFSASSSNMGTVLSSLWPHTFSHITFPSINSSDQLWIKNEITEHLRNDNTN